MQLRSPYRCQSHVALAAYELPELEYGQLIYAACMSHMALGESQRDREWAVCDSPDLGSKIWAVTYSPLSVSMSKILAVFDVGPAGGRPAPGYFVD